jgi:hypothetical protein
MAFDWFTSHIEARRALYDVTKRAVASRFLGDWNAFLRTVLGENARVGAGYIDNFRAGRISRVRAGAIARWLEEHEPALAVELGKQIRPQSDNSVSLWETLVRERAVSGSLTIVKIDDLRIVSFVGAPSNTITTLRRGEAFCFRLRAGRTGFALGLQKAGALWFPLPLSDQGITIPINADNHFLPRSTSGDVLPLSEENDTGPIKFVMMISPAPWLATFAQILAPDRPVEVERLSAQVNDDSHTELHHANAVII